MLRPITTASRKSASTPATTSARSWHLPRSTPPTALPAPSPTASRSRPSAPSTSPTSWKRAPARSPSPVRCSSPVVSICSTSISPRPTSLSMTEEAVTPSDLKRLDAQLDALYLSHVKAHYQAFATTAAQKQLSHLAYLAELIEGEAARRETRAIERRIKNARFPVLKTMEDFEWSWPKKINRPQIQNLFRLAFVATNTNVVFISTVGLGKTHICLALGRAACIGGPSALFTTAVDIINPLAAAQSAGRLKREIDRYLKPRLLIIDELGYLPIDKYGPDLLFQIISQRYERAPMVITTNPAYKHWSQISTNDPPLPSAILDRVLPHVDTILIEGKSFRTKAEIAC